MSSSSYHFDEGTVVRLKLLSIDIDIGWFSDWPRAEQTVFTSHTEMQKSPAWTLEPHGPMGTFLWRAELATILAGKEVRLDD